MVTFTINIPQMLAYIPAPWILWDKPHTIFDENPQPEVWSYGGVELPSAAPLICGTARMWWCGDGRLREVSLLKDTVDRWFIHVYPCVIHVLYIHIYPILCGFHHPFGADYAARGTWRDAPRFAAWTSLQFSFSPANMARAVFHKAGRRWSDGSRHLE